MVCKHQHTTLDLILAELLVAGFFLLIIFVFREVLCWFLKTNSSQNCKKCGCENGSDA